jgi:hypothetical protein
MGQRHQVFIGLENKENMNKVSHIESFGEGEKTVYAYHNGWMFGVSAVKNALRVLDFARVASKDKDYQNIFRKSNSSLMTNEETANGIGHLMSFITDEGGYSKFLLMNNPSNEMDNSMREEFDRGDNNDGILIIDTLNLKYCFMNIRGISQRLESITPFTPVSAEEYMRAYYPVGIHNWADKEIPKLVKKMNKFKVMTKEEVVEWFPKMRSRLIEEVAV